MSQAQQVARFRARQREFDAMSDEEPTSRPEPEDREPEDTFDYSVYDHPNFRPE